MQLSNLKSTPLQLHVSASKHVLAPEGHLKEVSVRVGHSRKGPVAQQYVGFNVQILETDFQSGQVNPSPVHHTV